VIRLAVPDVAGMESLGRQLAGLLRVGDVVALSGELGAGKTTLARAILAQLGLQEDAPSPTFTLVQTYDLVLPVWHVDLYRLEGAAQVLELGLDEAFETALCLIEWPERLGDALPEDALVIRLEPDGEGRLALLDGGPAWQPRLEALTAQP
jgi:tRNA threonylcarbamoyladenosine biosynthesis protein TsaE